MKLKILTLLIWLLPVVALAEEKDVEPIKSPETSMGKLVSGKGALLVRDFYNMGALDEWNQEETFTAVIAYEIGHENKKLKGLRIEITDSGLPRFTRRTYLDIEEVEVLASTVGRMIEIVNKWKPMNKGAYSEVSFSSKDNFEIGFYQTDFKEDDRTFTDRLLSRKMNSDDSRNMYMSIGYIKKAFYFSDITQLTKIKMILEKSLTFLNAQN